MAAHDRVMGLSLGKIGRRLSRVLPADALRPLSQPAALFFHGVEPATDDPAIQTNHHETAMFRRIMQQVARHFDVLPLSAIDAVLAAPQHHGRSLFLMSDDGYANTLAHAAPVLDALNLPWTLFVSTRHIDEGLPNPVFIARLFFLHAPDGAYALPHFPDAVTLGPARASVADAGVDHLRHLPAAQAEAALAAMRAAFPSGALEELIARFSSERFLDWDGVRALKARGVEIGAHADSHWPMHGRQNQTWLRQQAEQSKARIEAEIGPAHFFAYPFGNVGDIGADAWRAVRDAGFSHGFSTLSGSLAAGGNPWLLPRYGIGPADTHIAALVPLLRFGNARLLDWQQSLA